MASRFISGVSIFLFIFLVFFSCTKFDTTKLGGDVLPEVDNVNTFADTIDVQSFNDASFIDSTTLNRELFHAIGKINNDPLFGTTTANIFLQLKPAFYPYRLNINDTLVALDSVVLTLKYKGSWGDSSLSHLLEVRKVVDNGFRDSPNVRRRVSYSPNFTSTLLGSQSVNPQALKFKKFINNNKDSVTNQIRIRLTNTAYIDSLFKSDTLPQAISNNNAFRNDSMFRRLYNGLAITANNSTGNGLMYVDLLDNQTRLEIYFRTKNGALKDTVQSNLMLSGSTSPIFPSSTANNITRNRPAFTSPIFNYLQTAPGTSIEINIPRLNTYKDTNRIIHRAYLEFAQVRDNPIIDTLFGPPTFAYLDLKDTSTSGLKFKPIYIDLNPNIPYNPDLITGFFPISIDQNYFNPRVKYRTVQPIGTFAYYNINVTRYIQRMLINNGTNYTLRLTAPSELSYPQYTQVPIEYSNQIAFGRVRIGSGSYPDPLQRMKLVVIYSKVQ